MGHSTSLPDVHQDPSALLLTDGSLLFLPSWKRLLPSHRGNSSYTHDGLIHLALPTGLVATVVVKSGNVLGIGQRSVAFIEIDGARASVEEVSHPFPPGSSLTPPLCVLGDGRVMMGLQIEDDSVTALGTVIVDPETHAFQRVGDAAVDATQLFREVTFGSWTLLPNGQVLWIGMPTGDQLTARLFDAVSGRWRDDRARFTTSLPDRQSHYPVLVIPDGRVAVLTDDAIVYYRPPAGDGDGMWSEGPRAPAERPGVISAACLLPSGRILCGWDARMYEFSPASGEFAPADLLATSLLMLPTGEVLATSWEGAQLYRPDPGPVVEAAQPALECPAEIAPGESILLSGRLFNGVSQAGLGPTVSENAPSSRIASGATNYPLVRIEWGRDSNPHIRYCRTREHSTMAIATGDEITTTKALIPSDIPPGRATLRVITNGVPSRGCDVDVVRPRYREPEEPHLLYYVIGSPGDGGFLVVDAFGRIRPVPPWDPNVRPELGRSVVRAMTMAAQRMRTAAFRVGWSLIGIGTLAVLSTLFEQTAPRLAMPLAMGGATVLGAGVAILAGAMTRLRSG